jgi:hypothetical protein
MLEEMVKLVGLETVEVRDLINFSANNPLKEGLEMVGLGSVKWNVIVKPVKQKSHYIQDFQLV